MCLGSHFKLWHVHVRGGSDCSFVLDMFYSSLIRFSSSLTLEIMFVVHGSNF